MMRGFPDVHFRLMIEPEGKLTEKGAMPIFATKKDMKLEIDAGIEAGILAVQNLEASGWISNHELVL